VNTRVKAILQTIFLSGVLAIAGVSVFSQPSHAGARPDPRSLEVCPIGNGNCGADPVAGYQYQHRVVVVDPPPEQ
jgi:hypothetical protein